MMNYQETTEYLFSAMPSFQNVGGEGYKPGLERIEAFSDALDNPHRKYPTIHIAGTNGKGSTSHMLAAVLQSAGYRVGLFTSPHLKDFRERMRVNGAMISEQAVIDFVAEHRNKMEELDLSFFEMTAAMAFDYFAREGVDVAVIETGLGGRLDATNIVDAEMSVITNIAIDHTAYLGNTLEQIAGEKAGIIKGGGVVVVGDRGTREVEKVFVDRAAEQGAELIFAKDIYDVDSGFVQSFRLDLMGDYQRKNLVTLLSVVKKLRFNISEEHLRDGLSRVGELTGLRGRWQIVGSAPTIICDTGHNVHGLQEVTKQLKALMSDGVEAKKCRRLICVLGFARDKSLQDILPMFPRDAHFCFVKAGVERAFSSEEIGVVASGLNLSFECFATVADGVAAAKQMANRDDVIFIGGSTFVVAEL